MCEARSGEAAGFTMSAASAGRLAGASAGAHERKRVSAGDETRAPALPFATTNYTQDTDGILSAVLRSRRVYATREQTCVMLVDHYRERKTGPCYPGGGEGAVDSLSPRRRPRHRSNGRHRGISARFSAFGRFVRFTDRGFPVLERDRMTAARFPAVDEVPAHPRIPYGEANFRRIRLNRWLYVDKTFR